MHIAKSCYRQEICAKCAGVHNTKNCTESNDKIKCANCGKNHQTNSSECEVYTSAVSRKCNVNNHNMRSINFDVNRPPKVDYQTNTRANDNSSSNKSRLNYS